MARNVCLLNNKIMKLFCFICRIFAGPWQHWPHAWEVLSTGRAEAWWYSNLQFDPWSPQVCHSVSLGLPFRTGPRHPDLSRGVAHSAPHCAPSPAAEDIAVLRLHQMWKGVLGRLSLWPCPLHVSGSLARNRWGQWLSRSAHYSSTAQLSTVQLLMFPRP